MPTTEFTDGVFSYPESRGPFEMQQIDVSTKPLGAMPNPSPEMLADPRFEAIWQAIKSWDVNVPEYYGGYCETNGSHAALIFNALFSTTQAAK